MGTTQSWQLSYPEPADTPNVPRDIQELARDTAAALTSLQQSISAQMPDVTSLVQRVAAMESTVKGLQTTVSGIIVPDYDPVFGQINGRIDGLERTIADLGMPAPVTFSAGENPRVVSKTTQAEGYMSGYDMTIQNPSSTRNLLVRCEMSSWVNIPRGDYTIVVYTRPWPKDGSAGVVKAYTTSRIEGGYVGATGNGWTLRYDVQVSTLDVVLTPGARLTAGCYAWAYFNASATNKTPGLRYTRTNVIPIAWDRAPGRSEDPPQDEVYIEAVTPAVP
jgi:hypothetical protein